MADKIKVMIDKMHEKAKDFEKIKTIYTDEVLVPFGGIRNQMADSWDGDACKAFDARMHKHIKDLEKIIKILNEVISNIDKVADDFNEADKQVANSIKALL